MIRIRICCIALRMDLKFSMLSAKENILLQSGNPMKERIQSASTIDARFDVEKYYFSHDFLRVRLFFLILVCYFGAILTISGAFHLFTLAAIGQWFTNGRCDELQQQYLEYKEEVKQL